MLFFRAWMRPDGLGENYLQSFDVEFAGKSVELIHHCLVSGANSAFVRVSSEELEAVTARLETLDVHEVTRLAEPTRITAGIPRYGTDISDKNLPQEVGRDEVAISFVKGCYLGQETVARIDAMGHVNWHLRRLKIAGERVPEGRDGYRLRRKIRWANYVSSMGTVGSIHLGNGLCETRSRRGRNADHCRR